jgi:hypothetical protein
LTASERWDADRWASRPPDAVKQLLRELIDRVEVTSDRHAYPYFWVPPGCETATPSGKPAPNAPPVPTRQGDTGWLFVTSRHVTSRHVEVELRFPYSNSGLLHGQLRDLIDAL